VASSRLLFLVSPPALGSWSSEKDVGGHLAPVIEQPSNRDDLSPCLMPLLLEN